MKTMKDTDHVIDVVPSSDEARKVSRKLYYVIMFCTDIMKDV